MRESLFEALIGFVVVAVAAIFLFFSLQQRSDAGTGDSYTLTARFGRADITPGTDVRIAGVKVGSVSSVTLDPEKLKAEVKLTIKNGVQVPDDSTAQIQSDSLLGGSYVFVRPGGSPDNLPTDGKGKFEYTRDSIDIFGALLEAFQGGGDKGDSGGGSKSDGAQP